MVGIPWVPSSLVLTTTPLYRSHVTSPVTHPFSLGTYLSWGMKRIQYTASPWRCHCCTVWLMMSPLPPNQATHTLGTFGCHVVRYTPPPHQDHMRHLCLLPLSYDTDCPP